MRTWPLTPDARTSDREEPRPLYDVEAVRSRISALKNGTFLNTGTIGVSPDHVTQGYFDAYLDFQKHSQRDFTDLLLDHVERMGKVAAFFGAAPHEAASINNATTGINVGVMGFDWRAGDQVVIGSEEHPSGYIPWLYLRERHGIEVIQVKLPHNAEGILQTIAAAMTDRTKMVFISHVSSQTGLRVPERALADVVHERGGLLFLDGSQSAGQFPIDLHAYDCDLYCASCHKWMLGPVETGFLYVKDSILDRLRLAFAGPGAQFDYNNYAVGKKGFMEAFNHHAGKFDIGSRDRTKSIALVHTIDFLQELGMGNVAAHVKSLADQFKDELRSIPGISVLTPVNNDAIHGNGIVSFRIESVNPDLFRDRMSSDHNIFLRSVVELQAIRVSIALFTNRGDLELVLARVRETAR